MKRRNFIAATGVIFASTIASNVTAGTSTFNSLSSEAALNEFSKPTKTALKNFVGELEAGFIAHPNHKQLMKNIATPVRIIEKSSKRGVETISFKNRNGEFIKITIKKGVERVHISNEAFAA